MEKRVLLAIFLSFLVLYLYQALVVKPVPKTAGAPGRQAAPATSAGPAPSGPGAAMTPEALPTPSAASPAAPAAAALVGGTTERDVQIETRDVIAVFTTRGARLKSWRLKRFLDDKKEPL